MKRIIITGTLLFLVSLANAQCDNMFSNAKQYFKSKDYAKAKAQFQKVVNNCDSNKEIAQEYIRLCEGWMALANEKEENKKAQAAANVDSKQIKKLNDDISRLENENDDCARKNRAALGRMKSDSIIIVTKSDSITIWKDKYSLIIDPLRALGNEMNSCLKGCKEYKNAKFEGYDKKNDPVDIIATMSKNLSSLSEPKKVKKQDK